MHNKKTVLKSNKRIDTVLKMFGKRILNVEVYGDQTIYGIKYFKNSIVVPENTLYCYQIADIGTFITDKNYVTLTTLNTKVIKKGLFPLVIVSVM